MFCCFMGIFCAKNIHIITVDVVKEMKVYFVTEYKPVSKPILFWMLLELQTDLIMKIKKLEPAPAAASMVYRGVLHTIYQS